MKKKLAGIINISISNVLSIKRSLEHIGFNVIIIDQHQNIDLLDLLVLPGVGTFKEAMEKLNENNLLKLIEQAIQKNKKILGLCLGMQILFEEGEEFGLTKGIGFFKGKVENFNKYKVEANTLIGWNNVRFKNKNKLLEQDELVSNKFTNNLYYFVHSYFVKNEDVEIATSNNGEVVYSSIVKKDNVLAFQFHPEKSGENGIILLKNELINL
jgi:imidazole glycerol-phosphate synthase subunit HisH